MQSILGNTRKADITFHDNGRINISARVSKLLELSHGDVIDIMDGQGEIYLYVKHRVPVVGRHEGWYSVPIRTEIMYSLIRDALPLHNYKVRRKWKGTVVLWDSCRIATLRESIADYN